ncbi:glycine C-acetyltransferase [Lyngbya confervoides]|uniref:2-amino-3-ketobutyrate coenzyme A ligase n=1 Tax=Lyngbya confervoides BDU141951 TaxID=1574623 RepID=A0ABD4T0D2_9CYAN|nr:glycine C-acetyltransferase [Lyngbya confervoides]MCM1981820.1 glycine C-acetyltransferase [Lyngbya confervoides BDU141951]
MLAPALSKFQETLTQIHQGGLHKQERLLITPQGSTVTLNSQQAVLNFCANNYLGLANHPQIVAAAKAGLDQYGYGLSSVRFICGTHILHKTLEARVSQFLNTEETILYGSCFDANGGLFEVITDEDSLILSDALNHASIIDGIRLCKAQLYRYRHLDLADLEQGLQQAHPAQLKIIATDGVFSMEGQIAPLADICTLAERYGAMVMVDDSHGTGVLGQRGAGTVEYCAVEGRVDIITSTFGKALGGASGGFTTGRRAIIDLLRQRSRPYLFSNTLAPVIAAASLEAIAIIEQTPSLRQTLLDNAQYFRRQMVAQGFDIPAGIHPIVPIRVGEAPVAQTLSEALLQAGIYVTGFSYPVVPKGQALIRVQLSAAHTRPQIDQCVAAFSDLAQRHGNILPSPLAPASTPAHP